MERLLNKWGRIKFWSKYVPIEFKNGSLISFSQQINPEGKYVVDVDKSINITDCAPNCRVALRNDSYTLHKILPTKVDPLVSLMKVEKVPDSTYDMIGGLDKQIREIKEVRILLSLHCSIIYIAVF